MADESAVQDLCDEITCPICLEYFKDPVSIDCGHSFCQACITQCWGEPGGDASCPQCREPCQPRSFKPNRQLASIVEIAKKFRLQMARGAEALGRLCGRHQEPLKLFCEDDQALICVVCDKSKEHRAHKVIPKEEASEEYKEKMLSHLEFLNKERNRILDSKLHLETEDQNLLKQTEIEREKIVAEFKQLRQFLEEQEGHLLAKLKDLDDAIKATKIKHVAKLSEEMSSMENLIKEIEEKRKQPADEFLQDIRSILQRTNAQECTGIYENAQKSSAFPPELKKQIEKFSRIHLLLKADIETFRDTLLSRLRTDEEGLNEDMTFPGLVLSSTFQDKGIHQIGWEHAMQFSSVKMCYCWSSTMGTERINSGRHSWVVDMRQRRFWTLGVAKDDLREQNQINLNPKAGIWAVGKLSIGNKDTCCAFTSPGISQGQFWVNSAFGVNILRVSPQRIRVSLDYEKGSVTFADADQHTTIHIFKNESFAGTKLCSWLSMGEMVQWNV